MERHGQAVLGGRYEGFAGEHPLLMTVTQNGLVTGCYLYRLLGKGGRGRREPLTGCATHLHLGGPRVHASSATTTNGLSFTRRPTKGMDAMSDHTYRVIEIVGSSPDGIDAAIRNAVSRAADTMRGLDWFEMESIRGDLQDGAIAHFQVTLKVGFRLEDAQT